MKLRVLALALVMAGCGPARFRQDGFQYPSQPVFVRYAAGGTGVFVSADWRVDNYRLSEQGMPTSERNDDEYRLVRKADYDGDGREETYAGSRYILKLVNRKHGGVLWSQLVPLDINEKERNLDVLVTNYAEDLSGAGVFAFKSPSGKVTVLTRQYATKILDKKPRKVGRFEGLEATIELANLDQLKLDPESRSAKIRVLFVRTDYSSRVYENTTVDIPLLLVFGLHAQPPYFDASAPELDAFINAFELKEPAK